MTQYGWISLIAMTGWLVLALMLRGLTWDSKKSLRDETPAGGVLTGVAPPAGLQPLTPALV